MSNYYHEFVPGFNFWYVFVPMTLIIMYYVGKNNIYIKKGKRYRRYNDRFYRLMSIVASVMTAILVLTESGDGIVQVFDNCLSYYDDPIWSVIVAASAVGFIAICEAVACFAVAKSGECNKRKELVRRQRISTHYESNIVDISTYRNKTHKEISAM